MVVRSFSSRELLAIAMFMGFSASIIQVLLIREILTQCRGNEFIIGIIYASWFLGIYAGAAIKPSNDGSGPARRLSLSVFILPVLAAVSVYSSHLLQVVFTRTAGTFYSFSSELLIAFLFTLPVSFFVGLFFPSLVSLMSSEAGAKSGGTVFCIESLGSFAGGVIFSFILVDRINPLGIISILALPALFIVFRRRSRLLLASGIIPVLLIIFSGSIENRIIAYTWNRTHTGSLMQYSRTKFETVAVESSPDGVSIYGDGIFMYNLPDRYESRGIFHMAQSLREERKKILLSGSGPGTLLHNLLKADIDTLCYCDPDPALWQILLPYVKKFYPEAESYKLLVPGVELKHYLKNSSEKFDLIISIQPEPENIMINRFYTKEFYSLCREHLYDRGILVTAIHGFSDYMSAEKRNYIASIYKAFTGEFPAHLKTSGEIIYLAGAKGEGILTADPELLVSRYGESEPVMRHLFDRELTENFSPDELMMFFEKTQLQYFDSVIIPASENISPDSDLKPGAYWRNIILSAFREQSVLYAVIGSYYVLPAAILLISVIALINVRRRHGPAQMINGALIYIVGFISISTMLVMVLLYQNSGGIVYHQISLINALYMLGLGAGSFLFNRRSILKLHGIFLCTGTILLLIYTLTLYESSLLFWALILLLSFMCGGAFTVLFRRSRSDCYGTASVLGSMDNFGAIAGSLFTVLLLVPIAGIQITIIFNVLLIIPAYALCFAGAEA